LREKQLIRNRVWNRMVELSISPRAYNSIPPFLGQEQAADMLRGLDIYAKATRVFVPPDQAQHPVRLNVLRDGKILW
jgi:5-formyltetrahydrofolate cyclo-ligase